MNNEVVFQTQGITRTYEMSDVLVHALRGIDLKLYAGEFAVILGMSGSGKSNLLNILGGICLHQDRCTTKILSLVMLAKKN